MRGSEYLDWSHEGGSAEIVAYRPILNADEPAEPEAVEWNGEGMPPVGCECEFVDPEDAEGCWAKVRVLGRNEGIVWLDTSSWGNLYMESEYKFRPLRTAAQRAEESMAEAWSDAEQAASCGFKAIYRAIRDGKVPGVKLEGDK